MPPDALKDLVKFLLAHLESAVVRLDVLGVIEVRGQPIVHLNRFELRDFTFVLAPEISGEEAGGSDFVADGNNGVMELYGHETSAQPTNATARTPRNRRFADWPLIHPGKK